MFGNGKLKKELEEEKKMNEALNRQMNGLKSEMKILRREIDLVWSLLNDKQTFITKLRRIIIDHLKLEEYKPLFQEMEQDLKVMFKQESFYDPTESHNLTKITEEKEKVQSIFDRVDEEEPQLDKRNSMSPMKLRNASNENANAEKQDEQAIKLENPEQNNHEQKEEVTQKLEEGEENKTNELLEKEKEYAKEDPNQLKEEIQELEQKIEQNQDQKNTNVQADVDDMKLKRKALFKKIKQDRRYMVKPRTIESVTRDLYVFELEVKEYHIETFDRIKEFVQQPQFSPDEIHEVIEGLANDLRKLKYFKTIFPNNTKERCLSHLENYVFEIIYPKIFKIDEDARAFAEQLRDRLSVLRGLITFNMLDIPVPMRDQTFFDFAIKEFEKINRFKSPTLKIEAFQNCANHLIDVFIEIENRNPDADELFPLLMFTVLNSKVENLKIQVDYIFKYLRKDLVLGQMGFLIVNLKAIIEFLNDIDGQALVNQGVLQVANKDKQRKSYEKK